MKNTRSYLLWFIPAIAISMASFISCSKSTDKATEATEESDLPVFENFEAYMATGTTASVRENRLSKKPEYDHKTVFVIYGVDMSSENFRNGDFIWVGDVSSTNYPESAYDGISHPLCRAVIAQRKGTIEMLAPDADTFIIEGKNATKAQYDALPGDSIQRVTIDGKTLHIEKRYSTDQPNIDVEKVSDDEGHLMRKTFFDELIKAYEENSK